MDAHCGALSYFVLFIVLSLFLWILLCIGIISSRRASWLLCFSLIRGMCTFCHGLFALPLGVIGRLCSVPVARSVSSVLPLVRENRKNLQCSCDF